VPIRATTSGLSYYLALFDETGRERPESDGSLLSTALRARLTDEAEPKTTDVFVLSHGWMGDIPAAIAQYDRWMATMAGVKSDVTAAAAVRAGFTPLVVGLHWPSLPWGDEDASAAMPGLLGGDDHDKEIDVGEEVDAYARRIADTPRAREALRTIFDAAVDADDEAILSDDARAAYDVLFAESQLGSGDVAAPPGADQEGFDAHAIVEEARLASGAGTYAGSVGGLLGGNLGNAGRDLLLAPLRQVSFWKMKDRARRFGEGGANGLLRDLQAAAPASRFHLMGHSFGCIVVSAAVAGGPGTLPIVRPVESLFLVQGALSVWAYATDIPYAPGIPGYFHSILDRGLVRGSIVTTRSSLDRAVGTFYPRGAWLKKHFVLDDPSEFPKYGAVGTFGLQGFEVNGDIPIQDATFGYGFQPGNLYNLDASSVIRNGGGFAGAHSDIHHEAVAHVFWQMVLSAP